MPRPRARHGGNMVAGPRYVFKLGKLNESPFLMRKQSAPFLVVPETHALCGECFRVIRLRKGDGQLTQHNYCPGAIAGPWENAGLGKPCIHGADPVPGVRNYREPPPCCRIEVEV